jgi:hypothetical protein
VARFTLVALALLGLSELAPARAQFVYGPVPLYGYSGGYSYSYRSGFGFSFGGPRVRVSGFAGGFVSRSAFYAPPVAFGFAPFAPFAPFGDPFFGGWGPGFAPVGPFGAPAVIVPVPVPVPVPVIGANVADPDPDRLLDLVPRGARPTDFLVIAPKKEVTVPEVTRVAVVPRPGPGGPRIPFDPFRPEAPVKAEVPDADPKKEAARQTALGRAAFAGGDYGRAAEHFERATSADPADAPAYFFHAHAKFASGQYAQAVARLRDGLARDPRWPASKFDPTALYGDKPERFVLHLIALKKAHADNPNEATLEFLLGYQLWFSGDKADADKLFRAAEKRLAAPGPIALFK